MISSQHREERVYQVGASDEEDPGSAALAKPTARKARGKAAPKAAAAAAPKPKSRGPPPAAAKRVRDRKIELEAGCAFTCLGCDKVFPVHGMVNHHHSYSKCKTKHHQSLAQAWNRFV